MKFSVTINSFENDELIDTIAVPSNVVGIGDAAFADHDELVCVELPNTITSIGNDAFTRCQKLANINMPDNIASIGERAFRFCKNLERFEMPPLVHAVSEGMLSGCSELETFSAYRNQIISVADQAFSRCTKLATISGIYYAERVGWRSFGSCTSLTSIEFGNSLRKIGRESFIGCRNLQYIEIPESIESIGDNAFAGCTNLSLATLPPSIVERFPNAFSTEALLEIGLISDRDRQQLTKRYLEQNAAQIEHLKELLSSAKQQRKELTAQLASKGALAFREKKRLGAEIDEIEDHIAELEQKILQLTHPADDELLL